MYSCRAEERMIHITVCCLLLIKLGWFFISVALWKKLNDNKTEDYEPVEILATVIALQAFAVKIKNIKKVSKI